MKFRSLLVVATVAASVCVSSGQLVFKALPRGFDALALSGDGRTVVGNHVNNGQLLPARWSARDGVVDLPGGEAFSSGWKPSVSANGVVITNANETHGEELGIWINGQRETFRHSFHEPRITGVSDDGRVLVVDDNASGIRYSTTRLRLDDAGLSLIGTIDSVPAVQIRSRDMSADGRTITGIYGDFTPFYWTEAGGFRQIDVSDGPGNVSLSGDGRYVFIGGNTRWSESGGPETLGNFVPARASYDGSDAVGQWVNADGELADAALWTLGEGARSFSDLLSSAGVDLSGWRFDAGIDISADGMTWLGQGRDPDGELRSFLVMSPVPEPSVYGGLACALLAVLMLRKASRSRSVRPVAPE